MKMKRVPNTLQHAHQNIKKYNNESFKLLLLSFFGAILTFSIAGQEKFRRNECVLRGVLRKIKVAILGN